MKTKRGDTFRDKTTLQILSTKPDEIIVTDES